MYETMERSPYLLGGFTEYGYVLPESGRIRVPDNVPDDLASLSSCAFRSVMNGFDNLGGVGSHLVIELLRHPLELGDHRLDLADLATFLFNLESLRSHKTFTRFHLPAPLQPRRDGSNRPTRTAGLAARLRPVANLSFTSGRDHDRRRLIRGKSKRVNFRPNWRVERVTYRNSFKLVKRL
jgi:hypothetical protein